MPIYEYACTACGERVEVKQSFDDPPLQECQFCGGRLRKLFSPVGVVFKGSGFYSTDSKRSKTTDAKPAKSDTTKEAPAKSDTKSSGGETPKPAATATGGSAPKTSD